MPQDRDQTISFGYLSNCAPHIARPPREFCPHPSRTNQTDIMNCLAQLFGTSAAKFPGPHADSWIVEDRSVDEARPLRVVVIGSGISGIIASIRFRQRIPNLDFCMYEKNEDIGGTWLENRYPGCACGKCCFYFWACGTVTD